ncbi:MAG TPA: extracellular solute-binding protein [Pirellulales bacterium]|nr:extracellular solute-binding protein [Pirellulales bacterium]
MTECSIIPIPLTRGRLVCLAALVLVAFPLACGETKKAGEGAQSTKKELPWKGVSVRLVVAGDSRLAEAIGRLKGEWRATTGAELEVTEVAETETADDKQADAIVYPAYDLGILVERDAVRPLPDSELTNPAVGWEEILEADKTHDASWASVSYGFPFGSPTLVCCYRKDLVETLGREPPRTWADYDELAALLAAPKEASDSPPVGTWSGTIEPLAKGWAGLTLLARAASSAKHRNHYSTLFDMESMEPLIAGPPFVRALEELISAKKYMPEEALEASPERAHEALLSGRCGMALTWTSAAFSAGHGQGTDDKPASPSNEFSIGFALLPGSPQSFNPKTGQWDARRSDESLFVPMVGASGRLGSVTKASSQPDAAFQLLGWLSGSQWSERVSTASGETTLFRKSQLNSARAWTDPRIDEAAADEYAETVQRALSSADFFGAPRMAGRKRYLAALDEAVRSALTGEQTSEQALGAAAEEWRKITAELGLDQQRSAYRRSLGLR